MSFIFTVLLLIHLELFVLYRPRICMWLIRRSPRAAVLSYRLCSPQKSFCWRLCKAAEWSSEMLFMMNSDKKSWLEDIASPALVKMMGFLQCLSLFVLKKYIYLTPVKILFWAENIFSLKQVLHYILLNHKQNCFVFPSSNADPEKTDHHSFLFVI